MSDLSGLTAEAQKLALSVEYASKVQWAQALSAIEDLIKNPKQAMTDGSVSTLLIGAGDVAKAIGEFVPTVGVVGDGLVAAGELEPMIADGFLLILSTNSAAIPAETIATETNIEDQLGPNHGSRGY